MRIEIAYAEPEQQWLLPRELPEGTTLAQALEDAELRSICPALADPDAPLTFGVWSKVVNDIAAHVLQSGDRVEIYRPLTIDPMAARKARAEKARRARS